MSIQIDYRESVWLETWKLANSQFIHFYKRLSHTGRRELVPARMRGPTVDSWNVFNSKHPFTEVNVLMKSSRTNGEMSQAMQNIVFYWAAEWNRSQGITLSQEKMMTLWIPWWQLLQKGIMVTNTGLLIPKITLRRIQRTRKCSEEETRIVKIFLLFWMVSFFPTLRCCLFVFKGTLNLVFKFCTFAVLHKPIILIIFWSHSPEFSRWMIKWYK